MVDLFRFCVAYNPFVGKTQAWLEARLEEAQADLAAGKSTVSAGEGNVQFSKLVHQSPSERIAMLLRALNVLDPTTYPLSNITRVTRTVAVYSREV